MSKIYLGDDTLPNNGYHVPDADEILRDFINDSDLHTEYNYLAYKKAKAALLAHDLALLPEKYDNYTGTDMEDYQKGFCEAVDLMEQRLKEAYGGKQD